MKNTIQEICERARESFEGLEIASGSEGTELHFAEATEAAAFTGFFETNQYLAGFTVRRVNNIIFLNEK